LINPGEAGVGGNPRGEVRQASGVAVIGPVIAGRACLHRSDHLPWRPVRPRAATSIIKSRMNGALLRGDADVTPGVRSPPGADSLRTACHQVGASGALAEQVRHLPLDALRAPSTSTPWSTSTGSGCTSSTPCGPSSGGRPERGDLGGQHRAGLVRRHRNPPAREPRHPEAVENARPDQATHHHNPPAGIDRGPRRLAKSLGGRRKPYPEAATGINASHIHDSGELPVIGRHTPPAAAGQTRWWRGWARHQHCQLGTLPSAVAASFCASTASRTAYSASSTAEYAKSIANSA